MADGEGELLAVQYQARPFKIKESVLEVSVKPTSPRSFPTRDHMIAELDLYDARLSLQDEHVRSTRRRIARCMPVDQLGLPGLRAQYQLLRSELETPQLVATRAEKVDVMLQTVRTSVRARRGRRCVHCVRRALLCPNPVARHRSESGRQAWETTRCGWRRMEPAALAGRST